MNSDGTIFPYRLIFCHKDSSWQTRLILLETPEQFTRLLILKKAQIFSRTSSGRSSKVFVDIFRCFAEPLSLFRLFVLILASLLSLGNLSFSTEASRKKSREVPQGGAFKQKRGLKMVVAELTLVRAPSEES